MDVRLPDFIVIGAMKSATTTLHAQLARQPGLFMSDPKEPNYFSDDEVYARGLEWYGSLFGAADGSALRGESSTHYTKLPTHPRTVERMLAVLPQVKLIYVMRHPIDRLISHYIHERSAGTITVRLEEAIDAYPELVDYGRYSMQLEPYLKAFERTNLLPVFFWRLARSPQQELERIYQFLGGPGKPRWDHSIGTLNAGTERLRKSAVRDFLVRSPYLVTIRRRLIPSSLARWTKAFWRARVARPEISEAVRERLSLVFDDDLRRLGSWMGIELNCKNFHDVARTTNARWTGNVETPQANAPRAREMGQGQGQHHDPGASQKGSPGVGMFV